ETRSGLVERPDGDRLARVVGERRDDPGRFVDRDQDRHDRAVDDVLGTAQHVLDRAGVVRRRRQRAGALLLEQPGAERAELLGGGEDLTLGDERTFDDPAIYRLVGGSRRGLCCRFLRRFLGRFLRRFLRGLL